MYKEIISYGVLRDILLMFAQKSFRIKAAVSVVVISATSHPICNWHSPLYMSRASVTPAITANRRIRTASL